MTADFPLAVLWQPLPLETVTAKDFLIYSPEIRTILLQAEEFARALNHPQVYPVHMLHGLLVFPDPFVISAITKAGYSPKVAVSNLEKTLQPFDASPASRFTYPDHSESLNALVEHLERVAKEQKAQSITPLILLLTFCDLNKTRDITLLEQIGLDYLKIQDQARLLLFTRKP